MIQPKRDEKETRQANGTVLTSGSRSVAKDAIKNAATLLRRYTARMLRELPATRVWLLAVVHVACFAVIYWIAFAVRFDFFLDPREWTVLLVSLPWVVAEKAGVFYFLGHYRSWWSYVTFADMVALTGASVLSLVVVSLCGSFFLSVHISRGVLILDCLFTIVFLGAARAMFRAIREHVLPAVKPKNYSSALVVGTDDASGILAHQIHSQPELPYRVQGFLDTNGSTGKLQIGRIAVLGHVDNVVEIAAAHQVTDVLITAGVLPGKRLRGLMDVCQTAHLNLKIIPALEDRLNGNHLLPLRDIEINDLLRRDPVVLDHVAVQKLIRNRVILVTGAGGSIGSEICRQILKFQPKKLILVGRGENRIFVIERELRGSSSAQSEEVGRGEITPEIYSRIGDITDRARMCQIVEEFRPEVIFHAAAHKHVPLMEENPGEAVKNNVLGTKTVADLAHECGVGCFILISTDKAVRPTSVMGTTKHLAERYVMALSQESKTRFVVTRFGNVLGSSGSVVPIFQDQIRRGGPITVTDAEMTRYFMTIPEASQLVLQASAMGRGGEIFVLDMGDPVRIVDLATDMIRLSGLAVDAIEITYSGVRPGEKLHEQLYSENEPTVPTNHAKLRAARHRCHPLDSVRDELDELARWLDQPDVCICSKLRGLVPDYVSYCGDCEQCTEHLGKYLQEATP